MTVLMDASPWGLGAALVDSTGWVVECFESRLDNDDIEQLGIEIGSHRGQGLLEALVLLVVLRCWAPQFRGRSLSIPLRQDNCAAMALAGKLASCSPDMNWLGAEIALECE